MSKRPAFLNVTHDAAVSIDERQARVILPDVTVRCCFAQFKKRLLSTILLDQFINGDTQKHSLESTSPLPVAYLTRFSSA